MEAGLLFVLSKIQIRGRFRQLFYHRATRTYIIEIPIIKLWNKSDWNWSSQNPLNSLYLTSAPQISHNLSTNKALLFSMQPHPHTCNCYLAPTGLIKYLEFRLCKSCLNLLLLIWEFMTCKLIKAFEFSSMRCTFMLQFPSKIKCLFWYKHFIYEAKRLIFCQIKISTQRNYLCLIFDL